MSITPEIKITNTLTNSKEVFKPIQDGEVSIYACGVTVYDLCHLGHAMQAIIYDTIVRYLRYRNFQVNYVRNYTDVDDKIIDRAKERGISPLELSNEMIKACDDDLASVGVQPASSQPKVSDYIPEIISYIKTLIEKGYAYSTEKGDVYYEVRKKSDYGKLSNQKIEQLRSGQRILSDDENVKNDPLDFALWKSSKVEGASWESPWGLGRPGWHIECSVMSSQLLGNHFDIHGGGRDLVFPHHENEVAQSEAYSYPDCHYANYWMHSGLLTMNSQKMSKSTGNFLTIRDALKKYDFEVIRYNVFQVHYSSNVDFNAEKFGLALKRIYYFYKTIYRVNNLLNSSHDAPQKILPELDIVKLEERFHDAMDDDFNMPRAFVVIQEIFSQINEILDRKGVKPKNKVYSLKKLKEIAIKFLDIFGLVQRPPEKFFKQIYQRLVESRGLDSKRVDFLLNARVKAREAKDYEESDRLRDELLQLGLQVQDTPKGQLWEVSEEALYSLC
ncbi:MAG: cysteine--tRNA ligase [bacterium]|nr:cysteine--tRNA ligase [bacterium]